MGYERPEIIPLNYSGQMVSCATLGYVAVFPAIVWAVAAIWNVAVYTNVALTVTVGGAAFLAVTVSVVHTVTMVHSSSSQGE